MQVLDPKLSKMAAPNFEPNSLSGPSTVFQGSWSNQGGAPEDPPKKRQFVAQVEAKIGNLEVQHGPWEATNGHVEAQNGHLEA